jgi:hypothetical protein
VTVVSGEFDSIDFDSNFSDGFPAARDMQNLDGAAAPLTAINDNLSFYDDYLNSRAGEWLR